MMMFKNFKQQMGQIHGLLSQRQSGPLPSDTKRNSKEQVNAIWLSEKQLEVRRQEVVEKDNKAKIIPKKDRRVEWRAWNE